MKALVIGAALSGTKIAEYLLFKGYDVFLTDSNKVSNKVDLVKQGVQVYDEGHPDLLKNIEYDLIVKNPGIPYHVPFVKFFVDKGCAIYNEIEVASRFVSNFHYASITGTNGKTTTTSLLAYLLSQDKNKLSFAAGNIGLPLSAIAINHEQEECYIALEIAAFQLLGCESFHPCVSCCTNLTPDHLDYFKNEDAYYDAKMLVYKNQKADDWFLRNIDDEEIVKRTRNVPCTVIDYSINKEADCCIKNNQVMLFDKVLFDVDDLRLVGKHNLQNAMVAAMMAYKMNVDCKLIKQGIKTFMGVQHRIEFVKEHHKVRYYNDSKGTNVEATQVALDAFDKPVILLAGGYDKGTGFDEIKPYLHKIKQMIVFGDTKQQLKEIDPRAIVVSTMIEALEVATTIANENDVVLLSPMCASWDQFKNFEQRGDIFKEYVNQL